MLMSENELTAILLTLKLAFVVTLCLLLIGTPLAWWLSRGQSRLRTLVNAAVALPLVLPPTVIGFYFLMLLGPNGAIGQLVESMGFRHWAFSFQGLVVASCVYSLPFVVQPLQNTFAHCSQHLLDVASTLRASPLDRFFTVAIPMSKYGFISAAILCFAHTLGEFGVVLMIGGNIPGETQLISVLLYEHVEAMDYQAAHSLALILIVFSFTILLTLYTIVPNNHYLPFRVRKLKNMDNG